MQKSGYPDWFKPRDYLAGMEGTQVYANWTFSSPAGDHTLYTIPAGKTFVLRLLGNDVSARSDPAVPGGGKARAYFTIQHGLDGASASIYFANIVLVLPTGTGNSEGLVLPFPMVIFGGAGGNDIIVSNGLLNLSDWDGLAYIIGTLLD